MTIVYRFFCFFCISLSSSFAFSADYYVATYGDNNNPGTYAEPWETLQFSVDQLEPGDNLYILQGVYNEKISINVSGTPTQQITIISDSTFAPAILDGTGLTSQTAMIEIVDQSYITISNLEIRNNIMNDAQGILVEGNCQGITLEKNNIHNIHFSDNPNDPADETTNAQGIIVWGTDPLHAITDLDIYQNMVYDCRLGYSEGIAVNGNVNGFIIRNNFVYSLTNIGIVAIGHEGTCPNPALDQARNGRIYRNRVSECHSPYAACAGIYVDGAKNIAILCNSTHRNDYGIEVGCEHPGKSAENITVRNNTMVFNSIAGLAFGGYDYPGNSGLIANCSVYNNNFWKNDEELDGNGDLLISYAENSVIENNIFYANDQHRAVTFADPATTTVSMDYNIYFTTEAQSPMIEVGGNELDFAQFQASGQEAHGLFDDPHVNFFIDDFSFNLSNAPLSPCINAGNPNYLPLNGETDYFLQPRLISTVDIGVSEVALAVGLNEISEIHFSVFPNPAAETIQIQSDVNWKVIEIVDLSGKIVLKTPYSPEAISVAALKPGTYMLHCAGSGKMGYSMFVKH